MIRLRIAKFDSKSVDRGLPNGPPPGGVGLNQKEATPVQSQHNNVRSTLGRVLF